MVLLCRDGNQALQVKWCLEENLDCALVEGMKCIDQILVKGAHTFSLQNRPCDAQSPKIPLWAISFTNTYQRGTVNVGKYQLCSAPNCSVWSGGNQHSNPVVLGGET